MKDSCFTELKWAINRLGVSAYWEIKESPFEMTYLPTGQKIYFRGLDDPLKVTSITVEIGFLCWCWIEEAYEILKKLILICWMNPSVVLSQKKPACSSKSR